MSGGGGGPTSSTVTQSTIPEQFYPQVTGLLGAAGQQLFSGYETPTVDGKPGPFTITGPKPFEAYSTAGYKGPSGRDVVADLTQGQRRAIDVANWLGQGGVNAAGEPLGGLSLIDQQYGRAADFASRMGYGGMGAATQAAGYGGTGVTSGLTGQQLGVQGGAYYGGLGAGYGGAAAELSPFAEKYARQAAEAGAFGRQLATTGGEYYGGLGAGFGGAAAGLSPEAQRYGQAAADIGGMGLRAEELGRDITGQARGYAGQAADIGGMYERMATSPETQRQFMSPYIQNVIEQQKFGAQRQADIAAQQRGAAAARAGAFGGARQAIENAEANRALQSQMQGIEATGLQNAYQQAQANILNRAQLGLQGLSGAQQGLGTALQGGQLGLSGIGQAMAGQQAGLAGLGQAGQLYGLGMQGAGMGLQGVQQQLAGTAQDIAGREAALRGLGQAGQLYGMGMQGAGMGLQGLQQQLAGTAQGMQGAQTGLQGLQTGLGAYGLMGQAGTSLADITSGRLRDVMGVGQYQFGVGEQERQLAQQAINQQILNYQMAQERPFEALSRYNALLRGYIMPGQTTTQYQANAPIGSQLAGLGTAGFGLSQLANVGKKAGGTVRGGDGIDTLALNRAKRGH